MRPLIAAEPMLRAPRPEIVPASKRASSAVPAEVTDTRERRMAVAVFIACPPGSAKRAASTGTFSSMVS